MNSKKHSYFCYAAISEDGEGIFEHRYERDADSGELLEWFQEWQFGLEHVPNHSYSEGWQDILQNDLNAQKISAKIKKYKVTVEEVEEEE